MPDWAFHWAGYLIAIVAGFLMLLALFRDRTRGRSRCRKCWYDLSELGDVPITCPECGKAHTKPRHLRKTRRHKRLASVWLLVMVVGGYGMIAGPRSVDEGWYGLVPSVTMPWVVPHIRLNEFPQSERWKNAYLEINKRWDTEEGRRRLAEDMKWWIRLGLIDPAGYFGKSGLETSADAQAQVYSWTLAGVAFQQIVPVDELPLRAQKQRIENELSAISLVSKIEITESGLAAFVEDGTLPWDFDDIDVEVVLVPHPTVGASEGQLSLKPFYLHVQEFFAQNGPVVKLLITESPKGVFRVRANVFYGGEPMGIYDVDLIQDPRMGLGLSGSMRDYLICSEVVRVEE